MYNKILIPLEHSPSDKTILDHIRELGKLSQSALMLMHVADGWAARHYDQFALQESEEMKADRAYLDQVASELRAEGFPVEVLLAMGEPATEIIKAANELRVDLVAMATHGHGLLGDLMYGHTADKVRHAIDIPVLLLKSVGAK